MFQLKDVFVNPSFKNYVRDQVNVMLEKLRSAARSEADFNIISNLKKNDFARREFLDKLMADMLRSLLNTSQSIPDENLEEISRCIVSEIPRQLPFVDDFYLPPYLASALVKLIVHLSKSVEHQKLGSDRDWLHEKRKSWRPVQMGICVHERPQV